MYNSENGTKIFYGNIIKVKLLGKYLCEFVCIVKYYESPMKIALRHGISKGIVKAYSYFNRKKNMFIMSWVYTPFASLYTCFSK